MGSNFFMLSVLRNARGASFSGYRVGCPFHQTRGYAEYTERPVPKEMRKPLVHGVLLDPTSVKEVKEYRFAKEWHIFKRRYEVPLMNAYSTFLEESEANRIAEKKAVRKQRRNETAHIRQRGHIAQKKKHKLLHDTMIKRPWYVLY